MSRTKMITRTAVLLALLLVLQYFLSPFSQYIAGSAVNFILIAAFVLVGKKSAFFLAIASPFFARLFGIGPALLPIVPLISCGNVLLILIYTLCFRSKTTSRLLLWLPAIVLAALIKFLFLTLTINRILLPLLSVAEPMRKALSASFGIPQLFTALIGGFLGLLILPPLNRILKG